NDKDKNYVLSFLTSLLSFFLSSSLSPVNFSGCSVACFAFSLLVSFNFSETFFLISFVLFKIYLFIVKPPLFVLLNDYYLFNLSILSFSISFAFSTASLAFSDVLFSLPLFS